ncbi:MAG: discoidin domain-containing protein [Phycisphaerales bacterium]|nr:MAG: discoidin domain-containing protein [Phycisphaerales bacterium]
MYCRRLFLIAFTVSCCFLPGAFGIEPVNPNLDPSGREVLEYLASIYQTRMLCGYNVYVHTPDDYEQTAKHGAIWGRDIRWLGDPPVIASHAKKHGYILTLHWHWFYDDDSAWKNKRKNPVDVGRVVTPGTAEHRQAIAEMAAAADRLQVLEDADVPVLWRPLHEIDGGWFWRTDRDTPENTAKLWRIMYDYLTHTRKLDNLIWVYSAGAGNNTLEYRQRFYPGDAYVDISGIDIYSVDFENDVDKYWEYYNLMSKVSPNKMLACGECDAIPDPDKTQQGELPKWLYALPWWGTPNPRRPVDWARHAMRHDFIITLDELPALGASDTVPHVGILDPLDDGSAWYDNNAPVITACAVDRGGSIKRVEFYADQMLKGIDESEPYMFTWNDAPPGCYDIKAVAVDNLNQSTTSNNVRIVVGMVDLALGKDVVASSGQSPQQAVDGDYHSTWSSSKSDDEWIYVDLGAIHNVERVNLLWGWKIHAEDYSIDVALNDPDALTSWTTVYSQTDQHYTTWEATYRIRFAPTRARYVRMHATKRAGRQTWGGYQLVAFEVPVPSKDIGDVASSHSGN